MWGDERSVLCAKRSVFKEAVVARRIEVGLKTEIRDPLGEKVKRRIQNDLGLSVESVRTLSVFTVDMELSKGELEMVATGPFLDPINQEYRIDHEGLRGSEGRRGAWREQKRHPHGQRRCGF